MLLSELDNIIQAIREEVPEELWPRILARLDGESTPAPRVPEPDPVWDELMSVMEAMDE